MNRRTLVGTLAATVVLVVIIAGIWAIGAPSEARRERLDDRRVMDLDELAGVVDLYWTRRGALPVALDSVGRELGAGAAAMRDPATGAAYEYRVVEPRMYELCATFDLASPPQDVRRRDGFWSHGVGRQCFRREPRQVR